MNGQKLKFIAVEPRSAPEKLRIRNTEKSNIGRGLIRSAITKAMRLTMETPMIAKAVGLVKPRSGPCVMKKARQKTDNDSVTMPARSRLVASGSFDSRTPLMARISVTTANRTWMRNTHSQPDDRDDRAADDRAEAETNAEDDPPPAEGDGAFPAFPELMRENGDLADQHRAAAQALKKSGDDQHGDVPGQPADQRRDAERGDGDQEDALATISVGQRPGRHQHGRHRDRVGVHDPLQLLEVRVQHLLQRRQDRWDAGNLQAEHQGRRGRRRPERSCFGACKQGAWFGLSTL